MHNPKRLRIAILITILVGMISGGRLMAQNRGNNFAFQGLGNTGEISAKALALGGAYTSINGDIDAIQYNPAGLATIDRLQLSVGAGMLSRARQRTKFIIRIDFFILYRSTSKDFTFPTRPITGNWTVMSSLTVWWIRPMSSPFRIPDWSRSVTLRPIGRKKR